MIKLFNEKSLESTFSILDSNIQQIVQKLERTEILNSNIDDLVNKIARSKRIASLNIDFEQIDVKVVMKNLTKNEHPNTYDIPEGETCPRAKVDYTFTVNSGEMSILSIAPKENRLSELLYTAINGNKFTVCYQTFSPTNNLSAEIRTEVKNWKISLIEEMKKIISELNSKFEEINSEMTLKIKVLLEKRKKEIQDSDDQENDLK